MKVDQSTARAINRRLVLNLLRSQGPMSRAELASSIGLSPATVTFVVGDLLAEGLLVEGQPSKGATGRRPIPVEINYSGLLAVGIKLMVGSIECVLTDLSTNPLITRNLPLPDQRPETVVEVCARAVAELVADAENPQAKVVGLGVAVPGFIKDGVCLHSYRFGWTDVPLGAMLANKVNVPVWLDDDTNSFALAQQLFRLGRHHKTVGALAVGAGISCAVVVNGAVHRGASGGAGKLGHSIYDPNGFVCECGRRGCLQAHFSEPALLRRWKADGGGGPRATRHDLLQAALSGDGPAVSLLAEAGEAIGGFLATYCNIVDPEVVVVGGEAVIFGDLLFDPMRQALARGMLWTPPAITPDWVDNSWAQGAAALATQQVFDFEATGAAGG